MWILSEEICVCGHDDSWHAAPTAYHRECEYLDRAADQYCGCGEFQADCSQGILL